MSQTSKLALPLAPELLNPHTPIHYDQTRQTWHVFRYADVLRVLTSHAEFSQEYLDEAQPQARTAAPAVPHPAYAAMWGRDGDAHRDLRGLVREPFSARTPTSPSDGPGTSALGSPWRSSSCAWPWRHSSIGCPGP